MTMSAIMFTLLLLFTTIPAHADNAPMRFIRDAEIESYLRDLAAPIYHAAGIPPQDVHIAIVNDSDLNAFVAMGMNQFFFTGLLQAADTPEQLAGVIAHETGHISGGHLIRGREAMENASTEAILGMLLGVAAGAASGSGEAAAVIIGASQGVAQQGMMSFSRTQESAADSAGLEFLDKAGITSRGIEEFMQKLAGQEMLPADRQTQYVRTHPLTQDRLENISNHLKNSPIANAKMDPAFYIRHERMKAKLLGFMQPETALLRYSDKDARPSARYARAIALYRTGKVDRAIALMDELIATTPNDPFFHELKGQALFENGRVKEAISQYQKAVTLRPDSALLRTAYGHALLEEADKRGSVTLNEAIQQLEASTRIESHDPETWRFLAIAWGKKAASAPKSELNLKDDPKRYAGLADYALAEEAATHGQKAVAAQLAERAMKKLPAGSPYWLRANDIAAAHTKD